MPDIQNTELRRLDLTVLLVFLGLLRLRKATAVATEMGLTQSGVSQALRRLRDVFGDPLFLRRPHGMEPTAIALSLEGPVTTAVAALREALGDTRPLDPAQATGTLRLSALDAEQAALIPGLMARLRATAPGLALSITSLPRLDAAKALAAGQIDLALGFFPDPGAAFTADPLYSQGYAVVGQPALFAPDGTMPMDRYLTLPHVLVSPSGDLQGIVDRALQSTGHSRRVHLAVPQFFPALVAVAAGGCITTLPDSLARVHAATFGLATAPPPLPLRRFTVSALRHRRNARDARLGWLIDQLRQSVVAGSMDTSPQP